MLAASGLSAMTFNHRFHEPERLPDAASDVAAAVDHIRGNADALGIDKDRIALWAFSGGGPFLSLPLRDAWPFVRCLVAYYAVLDLQLRPPRGGQRAQRRDTPGAVAARPPRGQ